MRWLWICLVLTAVSASVGPARGSSVYSYVDENGVYHFTNAPVDARYKATRFTDTYRIPDRRPAHYDELIKNAARRFRLDPELIKAVIQVESNFERYAVSSKGAQGLMQLMPDTASDMGVAQVFDPRENILGGSRYLRLLSDRFANNLSLTLAAYNAGPETVEKSGGIPEIKETRDYVSKVLRILRRYRNSDSGLRLTDAGTE